MLADPRRVFPALVLPIAFGSAVLVTFARSMRWTGELFIGFAEELLTRGLAVQLLRRVG